MAPAASRRGTRLLERQRVLRARPTCIAAEPSLRGLHRLRYPLIDPGDRRSGGLHRLPARLVPQGRCQVLQVGSVHVRPRAQQLLGAAQCPLLGGHDVAGKNLVDGPPSYSDAGWMYSIQLEPALSPYRCRQCGAASYARLVHRGPDGAMGYADCYRCSGCSLTFSDPVEWRRQDGLHASSTQPPMNRDATRFSPCASGRL